MVTTISVDPETKDQLEDYRGDGHHNWDDVIQGLMRMVPPFDELQECSWHDCPHGQIGRSTPEQYGGVIMWFNTEYDGSDLYGSRYFCSVGCAMDAEEEVQNMAAVDPDRVIIGGKDHMRMDLRVDGMRLNHPDEYEDRTEIGFDAPLHLVGEDVHGNEFDYHGEPVYVEKTGKIRFSGIVDEIAREETHTAIYLGDDRTVEMAYHPDEDRREEWLESYTHWYTQECPECGSDLHVHEGMDDEIECGECEGMIERVPVPEDEIPDIVIEYRERSD